MVEGTNAEPPGWPPYIARIGETVKKPIVRNPLMATITMWHGKYPKTKVMDLIQKHFHSAEVFQAMEELHDLCGLEKPPRHQTSLNRTAFSVYAEELCSTISDITSKNKYPDYVVPANKLNTIPMETMSETEVGLSVRMEKLEKAVQELVRRPVTPAYNQGRLGAALDRGRSLSQRRVVTASRSATPTRVVLEAGMNSDGAMAAPAQVIGDEPKQPTYADSLKRNRQDGDGFILQGRVRKQKVAKGSSKVDLSGELEGPLSAPLNFYVGNTSLKVTREVMKTVLVKRATEMEESLDLEVLEVEEAGPDFPNRRTKCWKVTVPYSMKALMEKSELYPPGWTHRRFFERPSNNKRTKVTNQNDAILQKILQTAEEKMEVAEEDPRIQKLVEEKARQLILEQGKHVQPSAAASMAVPFL